jgi:hypothetical protein
MPLWKKIVDHPKFSLANILWRSSVIGFTSAMLLSWLPGLLPLLAVSSLLEVRAARASVNLEKE